MNFRTTLVLLMVVLAGGVFYYLGADKLSSLPFMPQRAEQADAGSKSILESRLNPDSLTEIQIRHDDQDPGVKLHRTAGGEWSLPGKWPARQAEIGELVGLLTGLRSRFAPIPIGQGVDIHQYGLDKPSLLVDLRAGENSHSLAFGEEKGEANRFSRATYVRLDNKPEVIRLGPGLIAAIDRPEDHYRQRRLFPSQRTAKEGDAQEKVDRLTAREFGIRGSTGNYAIAQVGDTWEIKEPVRDHVDPDKLNILLTAIPDIWAEQFVNKPKSDLGEYGLKDPSQTIRVTRPGGEPMTLLIGRQSQTKTRRVMRPAPNMGGPPMPPQQEIVHEEYRFAKLEGNDQIFEIKADKLKDLFVAADTLRDARVARFKTEDARRLEIQQAGKEIILVKDKDRWRIQKPMDADADGSKISELLDKLALLQARDKDIIDKADPKAYGLDKPSATLKLTTEEEIKEGEKKTKKARNFAFVLGKQDAEKNKHYVRLEGWDRVNAVDDKDGLVKLVDRPALAYRGRKVLDFNTSDLAKVEIQRPGEAVTLQQEQGDWKLTAPAAAEVDKPKVGQVVDDLGRLEAVEYVAETATPDALDKTYSLSKPALTVKLTFSDAKKPAETLLLGKEQADKQGYFAKLASAPAVFVLKKEIFDTINQDSLVYRPLQLWQLAATDINEVRLLKSQPEFQLKREGTNWKVAGPFDAVATAALAQPVAEELANLRADRYVAHAAKDPATYGLDKPYLRVTIPGKSTEKEKPPDRVLLVGKPADKDPKGRYAKLADKDGVFVLADKTVAALDHAALDFLDRSLLMLDLNAIEKVRVELPPGKFTLQRQGESWRVTESPAPTFVADREALATFLSPLQSLQAIRFAAYGMKVNPAEFGFDKPQATITATVKSPPTNGKETRSMEHSLVIGKAVDGHPDERYVWLDKGPSVAILGGDVVAGLTKGHLDFAEHSLLTLDRGKVTGIQRRLGKDSVEITRQGDKWAIIKPTAQAADSPTMDGILDQLSTLRAKRIASFPAKDLKTFGLDEPAAVVTIKVAGADGKPVERVIKIGRQTNEPKGSEDRFAIVEGSTAVAVLSGDLARQLTASPLQLRDRTLAKLSGIDKVTLERGPRKATFSKTDAGWKLTEPVDAQAEQTELDELVNAVSRLRADELVAEKPADLKKYGLDRPTATWRFQSGGKEVLSLLVGGKEPTKAAAASRQYAKLANNELVFLLDAALTARAVAEHRSRTVWPTPLDAVQIDRLGFGYASGPFTLEKVDNAWRVAGKPEIKVNADTIREALDALAGLKVAHYVADKGGDLKLAGLDPAQLVLEIQTPTGKRTLHIGRPEGESGRHYARLPEDKQGAVWVISEEDARRVLLTLAKLSLAASKPAAPMP